MRRQARIAAAFAAAAVIAAASTLLSCFEAPEPACAFACGDDGACPASYRCTPDGWCKREGVSEDHDCGASPIDAAPPDAGEADPDDDAAVDAEPDAQASRARNNAARAAAPRYMQWC